MKKLILLFTVVSLFFLGCSKDNPVNSNNQGNNPTWHLIYQDEGVYHFPYSLIKMGYFKISDYSQLKANFEYKADDNFNFVAKTKTSSYLFFNLVDITEKNVWYQWTAYSTPINSPVYDDTLFFYGYKIPLTNVYIRNVKFYGYN